MVRKQGVMWLVIVLTLALSGTFASALNKPQAFSMLDVSANVQVPIGGFAFNRPPAGGDQFAIVDNLYKWAGPGLHRSSGGRGRSIGWVA
jgi:hypothetical protein